MLFVSAIGPRKHFDPSQLRQGGYVVYFRHGSAELGHDNKTSTREGWWRTTDPDLTRQLDDHGWDQAQLIGEGMRDMGLHVDHVLASEFRRAEDTALAMDMGEPETTPDLTPLVYDDSTLPQRIEHRLNTEPNPGTITVLVAHGHHRERDKSHFGGATAVGLQSRPTVSVRYRASAYPSAATHRCPPIPTPTAPIRSVPNRPSGTENPPNWC